MKRIAVSALIVSLASTASLAAVAEEVAKPAPEAAKDPAPAPAVSPAQGAAEKNKDRDIRVHYDLATGKPER